MSGREDLVVAASSVLLVVIVSASVVASSTPVYERAGGGEGWRAGVFVGVAVCGTIIATAAEKDDGAGGAGEGCWCHCVGVVSNWWLVVVVLKVLCC